MGTCARSSAGAGAGAGVGVLAVDWVWMMCRCRTAGSWSLSFQSFFSHTNAADDETRDLAKSKNKERKRSLGRFRVLRAERGAAKR